MASEPSRTKVLLVIHLAQNLGIGIFIWVLRDLVQPEGLKTDRAGPACRQLIAHGAGNERVRGQRERAEKRRDCLHRVVHFSSRVNR